MPIALLKCFHTSGFLKHFQKLPRKIQEQAAFKEQIFRQNPFDPALKTHKLSGKMSGFLSFSINYQYALSSLSKKTPPFLSTSAPIPSTNDYLFTGRVLIRKTLSTFYINYLIHLKLLNS